MSLVKCGNGYDGYGHGHGHSKPQMNYHRQNSEYVTTVVTEIDRMTVNEKPCYGGGAVQKHAFREEVESEESDCSEEYESEESDCSEESDDESDCEESDDESDCEEEKHAGSNHGGVRNYAASTTTEGYSGGYAQRKNGCLV